MSSKSTAIPSTDVAYFLLLHLYVKNRCVFVFERERRLGLPVNGCD